MKRLFPLLLCLLLALFPAPRAQGESAALLQSDMPNIRAAFLWEGVPYAFAGNELRALDGSGEILPIELEVDFGLAPLWYEFLLPVQVDGQVCLLARVGSEEDGISYVEYGALLTLSREGGAAKARLAQVLDWSPIEIEANPALSFSCAFAQGETLYLLVRAGEGQAQIAAFDCADGSAALLAMEGVSAIAPYTEQAMLAVRESGELGTIAYDGLAYAPLGAFPGDAAGLYYDGAANALYYVSGGNLCALADMRLDDAQILAAFPPAGPFTSLPAVAQGAYILADARMVYQAPLAAAEQEARQLRLEGRLEAWMDRAYYDFLAEHPGVQVARIDGANADILGDMLRQSPDTDIYLLDGNDSGYSALFERGYMAPLADEELAGQIAQMYPMLQRYLVRDGVPVAVPLDFADTYLPAFDAQAFALLGIEAYPETWVEFFDLLSRAPELLAGYEEEIGFSSWEAEHLRTVLLQYMVPDYIRQCEAHGRPLRLDTPQFRAALSAWEAIDWQALEESGALGGATPYEADKMWLFHMPGFSVSPSALEPENRIPALLAYHEDEEPMILVSFTAAFVNPYSDEQALATEYVAALFAEAVDTNDMLLPKVIAGWDEPIEDSMYEQMMRQYEDTIAEYTRQLENDPAPMMAARLEEQLRAVTEERVAYAAQGRYRVSPESLRAYQQATEHMYIATTPIGDEIYALLSQYLDGAIDGEALIRTIDERLYMMEAEG